MNRFRRFNLKGSDKPPHITSSTALKAALSSYQEILPRAVQTVVLFCVWKGNSSKSTFLHQRDLELLDSHNFPTFPHLYPKNFKETGIFLLLCKIFTLYSDRQKVCKLTVIQASTAPHSFVKNSCTPRRLLCRFVLFWGTKWVALNFTINKKTPNSLITFLSASWKSSIIQDIPLQRSTELKIEGKKSFTKKQKRSLITWPTKYEFGPRLVM